MGQGITLMVAMPVDELASLSAPVQASSGAAALVTTTNVRTAQLSCSVAIEKSAVCKRGCVGAPVPTATAA